MAWLLVAILVTYAATFNPIAQQELQIFTLKTLKNSRKHHNILKIRKT